MINNKVINKSLIILLVVTSAVLSFTACRKDNNFLNGEANITVSQDTILFDTVFTTIGSATKRIKIFNNEGNPIKVDVTIGKSSTSVFRMNVDGFQGKSITDVEIPANDSIYVFVEVTVNPDEPLSISPFVIEDDIIIEQGGRTKIIKLIAWGQNANYISQRGEIRGLACSTGSVTFDDDKPYVIYGILVIDSCELIIPAGRSIHIHGGVVLEPGLVYNDGQIIIFPEGKLTVNGTKDQPVIFEGDRLDPEYSDLPGQWVGIRIFPESKGNSINYADIRNGILGVFADSASSVEISNTIIKNTSASNIIGIHADIKATNVLMYNAGSYNAQLTYGGNYEFNYCTIANESFQREAIYINNYKCTDLDNDPLCQSSVDIKPANLLMRNCILYGPSRDELNFDDYTLGEQPSTFNYQLEHCLVRVEELLDPEAFPTFFNFCNNCLNPTNIDTLFRDLENYDFRLDTMSIAEQKGTPIPGTTLDLLGIQRDISNPDLGCYEFEN